MDKALKERMALAMARAAELCSRAAAQRKETLKLLHVSRNTRNVTGLKRALRAMLREKASAAKA